MPAAEVGYAVFFAPEEAADVFEFLKELDYPPNVEGMRQFLLDEARDDGEDDDEEDEEEPSAREQFAELLRHPDVVAAAAKYGPHLMKAFRRFTS